MTFSLRNVPQKSYSRILTEYAKAVANEMNLQYTRLYVCDDGRGDVCRPDYRLYIGFDVDTKQEETRGKSLDFFAIQDAPQQAIEEAIMKLVQENPQLLTGGL